ncbi:MAG: extracellular solute-binding protein [Alphaproteobacteria bacterium]|nr:extracellular solute-binding protein [Alphaproteobacteria bacterium]
MTDNRKARLRIFFSIIVASVIGSSVIGSSAQAAPSHCLSLYDPCKYPANFSHFDYVNPDAPKGGSVKLADSGTFDSLNPFILKGVKAPAVSMIFDALMVSSLDEPQSMYGLIAESADLSADKSHIDFVLRKEARFHDGTPITADDVVFSFETLITKGDPTYRIMLAPVKSAQKIDARHVRFTLDREVRESALIAASLPVFSKAYYSKVDFEKTTLEPPLGSGAYKVQSVDPGRAIIYERVKNYWAKNLPFARGQYNFDTIRYDLYRDENVALEAFKSGQYDFRREYVARNWAKAYDHPAVKDGRITKRDVPDMSPQGMQGFVYNTRKPTLSDRRVREAIGLAMDYEWLNKTIFYGAYKRNRSFFGNTDFESKGKPSKEELALLSPYKSNLSPTVFEHEYAPPVTDGSGNPRENLLKAQALLNEAGWKVEGGKRMKNGQPLTIEFMLRQPTMERVIGPMRKNLERLGITSSIRMVDDSQYQKRIDEKDFDIVSLWINRGLFYPGNEQVALWHSSQADVKGGNNLAGAKNPAVDAALAALIGAKNKGELVAAGRALDRILLWENYVIPNWQSASFRIAYWNKFGMPPTPPKYGLAFESWWIRSDDR